MFIPTFYGSLRTRVLAQLVLRDDRLGGLGGSEEVRGRSGSRFLATNDTVSVHLYDIINIDDVRKRGATPSLSRRGPFVFSKQTYKVDVKWAEDGRMVSYRENVTYEFHPSQSTGTLRDRITTVNVPLVGVLEVIMDRYGDDGAMSASILQVVAGLVEKWQEGGIIDGLFMNRSVGELLGGYTDGLLEVLGRVGVEGVDPWFGLLAGGVDAGRSAQWTGVDNMDLVAELHAWHGMRFIRGWDADLDPPEVVRGTRGRQFAPGMTARLQDAGVYDDENDSRMNYTVWVGDAYRAFDLRAVRGREAAEIRSADGHGVMANVKMLTAGSEAFEASSRYQQMHRGLLNITGPTNQGKAGVSLFLSLPGFCGVEAADVVDSIEGVSCLCDTGDDACIEQHIRLDLEPLTGMVIQARKALMLSTHIGPRYRAVDSGISSEAFVPIMEVEERGSATLDELQDVTRLQRAVGLCVAGATYLPWVSWVMIAGGIVLVSLSTVRVTGDPANEVHAQDDGYERLPM